MSDLHYSIQPSLSSAERGKLNCQVFPAVSTLQHCTTGQAHHISCSLPTLQYLLVSMSRLHEWDMRERQERRKDGKRIADGKVKEK